MKKLGLALLMTCLSGGSFGQDLEMKDFINKDSQNKTVSEIKLVPTGKYAARGGSGSGVGGGNLYDDLTEWCDEATIILSEAMEDAQDLLSEESNHIGAIRKYYKGIRQALEVVNHGVSYQSSITYKALVRGLVLSHKLGVTDIITGTRALSSKELKKVDEIYNFFDGYYRFLKDVVTHIDLNYYLNYYASSYCSTCSVPGYTVNQVDFEKQYIIYATEQVNFWIKKFIFSRTNRAGVYSILDVPTTLKGLSYLLMEASADLGGSEFDKLYSCQVKRFKRLSGDIDDYLYNRVEGSTLDAKRLDRFVTKTSKIINSIEKQDCTNW